MQESTTERFSGFWAEFILGTESKITVNLIAESKVFSADGVCMVK